MLCHRERNTVFDQCGGAHFLSFMQTRIVIIEKPPTEFARVCLGFLCLKQTEKKLSNLERNGLALILNYMHGMLTVPPSLLQLISVSGYMVL